MPKYLVETISYFRHRYVIECDSAEHAKDTVTMNEAEEFGQIHIDENIIGCREIGDEEVERLFFEDHPYLRSWVPGKAHEFVHKVEKNGKE
jgi:hypothetical protein